MLNAICVDKFGNIKQIRIETDKDYIGENDMKQFKCTGFVHNYEVDGYNYCVYGNTKNVVSGNENIYELPPPIDNIVFFGSIYIVKCEKYMKKICKNVLKVTTKEWKKVYECLFGGFEDIDNENSEISSYDEEYDFDKKDMTKSGYFKDGFVVSDQELYEIENDINKLNMDDSEEYESDENYEYDDEEESEEESEDEETSDNSEEDST